jgi:uncharacterized protein YndB with AHSA1/START domain
MAEYKPLTITRTLNATAQAVWDAWTTPEQFKQWYMPAPFTVPSCEFDVRPGGKLRIETQDPQGNIMPVVGEFTEVEQPKKLVQIDTLLDADGNKLFDVRHSLTLTENNGQTTLEITSEVLWAGPNADQFLSGMEPGLNQALDQLTTLLAQ